MNATVTSDRVPPRRDPPLGPIDEAVAWIGRQASAAGFGPVVAAQSEKLTNRSIVLRIATRTERLFFKAGPGPAHREAQLTAFLASRYPAHFPAVIAFDQARGWMLMREVSGPTLLASDVAEWRRALETLGRIQHGFADAVDALFELGCRQRTAASLAAQLDPFVEYWCSRRDVDAGVRRALIEAVPIWRAMCTAASSALPPATLDHIDLHPRNVVIARSGPVFLDWEGCAIGHPFWSPLILLGYLEWLVPHASGWRRELRTAYLRPWTARLPMRDLVDAFERARPLASLKYALGLWRMLAANETGEEAGNLRTSIGACVDTALAVTLT
jgi:aminoglycoside phosphotransferase (APT) family kinase protein